MKKYQIIYADPPWKYKVYSKKGEGRSAENHYSTMSMEDIGNMPINNLADKNCVLFLWLTFPTMKETLGILDKWGFKYKTVAFVWIKQNKRSPSLFMGLGFWTRANAEICIIATKGNPKRESKKVHQVIISPIREHSRKPDEIRNRIVELIGDLPRIELFARQKVDGWDSWGNEIESDIDINDYIEKEVVKCRIIGL